VREFVCKLFAQSGGAPFRTFLSRSSYPLANLCLPVPQILSVTAYGKGLPQGGLLFDDSNFVATHMSDDAGRMDSVCGSLPVRSAPVVIGMWS